MREATGVRERRSEGGKGDEGGEGQVGRKDRLEIEVTERKARDKSVGREGRIG